MSSYSIVVGGLRRGATYLILQNEPVFPSNGDSKRALTGAHAREKQSESTKHSCLRGKMLAKLSRHRHEAKGARKGAEDDVLLDSLATMGLSFDGRAKKARADPARKGQGDPRLLRRKSWDSVMTPSLDGGPASFDKVAKETGEMLMAMEAGELLMAMYGGARGRALSSFDVSAVDEHSMRYLAAAAADHLERADTPLTPGEQGLSGRRLERLQARLHRRHERYRRHVRSDRHHAPRFSGTDYRSAAPPPRRRTVATPRRSVGSGAVLDAVPERSVLVMPVPPAGCDGSGARRGARWRWRTVRAGLCK